MLRPVEKPDIKMWMLLNPDLWSKSWLNYLFYVWRKTFYRYYLRCPGRVPPEDYDILKKAYRIYRVSLWRSWADIALTVLGYSPPVPQPPKPPDFCVEPIMPGFYNQFNSPDGNFMFDIQDNESKSLKLNNSNKMSVCGVVESKRCR